MERIVLNKEAHPESLEQLCAAALSAGDVEAAFMYADRRCRIQPLAKPHHFTLRAETLMRLGDTSGAIADIETALALAPEDIQANRRMLSWGDTTQQISAARALAGNDDNGATLARALGVLRDSGVDAIGSVRASDEIVAGWAAWTGDDDPVVTLKGNGSQTALTLVADAAHPLAGGAFAKVAGFEIRRDEAPGGHTVELTLPDRRFFSQRLPANANAPLAPVRRKPDAGADAKPQETGITVIVPVYRDLAATRACLESLAPEIAGRPERRAILVNDATPEPKLAKFLRSFSTQPGFALLTNECNLGFVGSVNRALVLAPGNDIILLNADTVLPPGCLDRLAEIGADPEIGTVTPLSNNGEFTSFPVAFEQNPLPSREDIVEIDRVAAEVNRGRIVDMPNGIGFCMFISRRCLDTIGPLSPSYQRGYLEDVDFCLRAREHGFRNVCAPSIFVGHHGSRSFGADKRALVVRNIAVTEAKFPDYREECALFMAADPLRPARAVIERHLRSRRYDRALVCGNGLLGDVARHRAETLGRDGKAALLLRVVRSPAGLKLEARDGSGEAPQSLTFDISGTTPREDLRRYLKELDIGLVEIVDPAATPPVLIDALKSLAIAVKVIAADAGVLCPRGTLLQADGSFCTTLERGEVCASCRPHGKPDWRNAWMALCKEIEPPCDEAREFARFLSRPTVPALKRLPRGRADDGTDRAGRIGLAVQGRTIEEFRLIGDFLRAAVKRDPEQAFVVIGATFDDLALMTSGNAFVSGDVKAGDHAAVLAQYGVGKIFLPLRRPLFGHPSFMLAKESGLPLAYFDWSFGRRRRRPGDLAIDPRHDLPQLVSALGVWGGF